MDVHTPQQRSFNMSRIKRGNTKPEEKLRKLLWNNGFRYRLHYKKLPGKPDIVFPSRKKVIFVNGCFWHKHNCRYFKWPQTNTEFWEEKITANVTRDNKNYNALTELGWCYLIIWECEIKTKDTEPVLAKLLSFLE
jgi:DNA mismatch endonuclease (patch repair protein)